MKNKANYKKMRLIGAVAMTFTSSAQAQLVAVAGGITTSMTKSQTSSELHDLIDKGRDTGDYLTMRSAMEAKSAIETWKEANKELLDKAFSELQESQRHAFANAIQLVEQANDHAAERLETAQQIVKHQSNGIYNRPYSSPRPSLVTIAANYPIFAPSVFRCRVRGDVPCSTTGTCEPFAHRSE